MNKAVIAGVVAATIVVAGAGGYRYFLVSTLKTKVSDMLSDPESAQFKDLRLVSDWSQTNAILCGQVNAKNKLGGYAGFKHFQSYPQEVKLLEEPPAQKTSCELHAKETASWWWIRW